MSKFLEYKTYTQNEVYMKYRELQREINDRIKYYESMNQNDSKVRRELLKLQLLKKQTNKNFNSSGY